MEKFITPEGVETEYGVKRETLTQWRANVVGPDFIKWKDRILYHADEIEGWFKIETLDLKNKATSKPMAQKHSVSEPEINPHPEPKAEPKPRTEPVKKPKMPKSAKEDEFLTPKDIEERYQISAKTLANWRSLGKGPHYIKLGNAVRYNVEEVERWLVKSRYK